MYWFGVVPGQYRPFFLAVANHPERREFSLDLTELGSRHLDDLAADAPSREYRARIVQMRMHQARFRQAVLRAYRSSCAVCRLKRGELGEAAHVVGDADGGQPVVTDGMALCKLHHAGSTGTSWVCVRTSRSSSADETDGPMLKHGLQGFHGLDLSVLPTRVAERPAAEFLARRWSHFRDAG